MISKDTIRAYALTHSAIEVLEECGCTDYTVDCDYTDLVGGRQKEAALLANCTDGANNDRVQGWTEYVAALVAKAVTNCPDCNALCVGPVPPYCPIHDGNYSDFLVSCNCD